MGAVLCFADKNYMEAQRKQFNLKINMFNLQGHPFVEAD